MPVRAHATRYIRQDALAKIGSDGLIGSRIVVLYGGSTAAPELQDGDVLAAGEAASTEQMMTTLQANNENLLAITSDLKRISGRIAAGEGTVGRLLGEDALHTKLVDTVSTLEIASDNAQALTASLSTFATKLNQKGALPNDLVTDTTTYASLTGTVGHLNQAGERASNLMSGLAAAAADPATPIGTLMRDEGAGADLKGTLDNLNRGSVLLNEDLAALQHNFLLRPYFRKKARAEAKAAARVDDRPEDRVDTPE